jgi:hypothetical protein
MAALNKGKHNVTEIDNVTCSVVETGADKDRIDFLKSLLEFNGYEVKVLTEEGNQTFTIGVTDILFNSIVDVYKRRLNTPGGHKVTPAYWLQKSLAESETEVNYWNLRY